MRRLLVLLLAGLVGAPPVHAGMLDTIKKATKTDVSRQDRTGMTLRGGVHLQTGEQPRSTTLWRGQANVRGNCMSFDFRGSMKEAFEKFPELFTTLALAVVKELPLLAICYFEPTECDLAKHLQSLFNAMIQAKFAQCQQIQHAMAYAGLRLSGGQVSQCLEDMTTQGVGIDKAMQVCNTGTSMFRLPSGLQGDNVNVLDASLEYVGASQELRTLAGSFLGELNMRKSGGGLGVDSHRPRMALLARYEEHKVTITTSLEGAVEEYTDTGTVTEATMETLTIPGQAFPIGAIDTLAVLKRDPLKYQNALGKLSTALAIASLTADCQEIQNLLAAASEENPNLTDEARRNLERKGTALNRNLAQVLATVDITENHVQKALDNLLYQHAQLQNEVARVGLRIPTITAHGQSQTRQLSLGYAP
jgi:hypothetical protein